MQITFFETFGAPNVEGECTILREGVATLSVAVDTFLNQTSGQLTCRINDCDYKISGPNDNAMWSGIVNPNTRRQRVVRFAELKRADGASSSTRIVLLDGHVQRGEAVLDVRPSSGKIGVPDDGMVCFARGSRILTAFGDLPVEQLRVGDLVHTADNGLQPVTWIGARDVSQSKMALAPHLQPIKISRDAFGPGLPSADIWVSQQHKMLLEDNLEDYLLDGNGVLAPAIGLVNDGSIHVDAQFGDTQYIHLLFAEHEIVFVDRLPTESFFPCPNALMSLTEEDRRKVFEVMPRLEHHPLSYGPFARATIKAREARILAA